MKSKVQTAPKQLLRRGLDDGTERLRGQFRDASQRGQRDDYGGEQIEDAVWNGTRWGTHSIERLLKVKKNGRPHTPEAEPSSDTDAPEIEWPEPDPAELSTPGSRAKRVRIKSREPTAQQAEGAQRTSGKRASPSGVAHPVPERPSHEHTDPSKIKTREYVWQNDFTNRDGSLLSRESPASEEFPRFKLQDIRQIFQRRDSSVLSLCQESVVSLSEQAVNKNSLRQQFSGIKTRDAYLHQQATAGELPAQENTQGKREFVRIQGRGEAVKRAEIRRSKRKDDLAPQVSVGERAIPKKDPAGSITPFQTSAGQSSALLTQDRKAPGSFKERTKGSTGQAVKKAAFKEKGTVKAARGGIKSSRQAAKTAERTAKTAQKVRAPQRAAKAARATTKAGTTAAKATAKATLAALRAAVAAAQELAATIMAGGWVVAVITLIICIAGLLVTSPFGLFFSDPGSGMTIPEAVAQLNGEFTAQIEQIKTDNPYDALDFDENGVVLVTDNWINVLAVYSVRVSSSDGTGASVLTDENMAILRETFWDMNQITYSTETVEHEDEDDKTILHISITTKTAEQIANEYGFTEEQKQLLEEMLKPEYRDLFQSLIGSGPGLTLSNQEVQEILSRMPDELGEERRQVVLTAFQLLGKVNYFWGGKSLVLGWDSRWGTPKEVWAAGSPSTGTVRPYGLDCSGFVDWVFYNVSGGTYVIGHGGGAHMQHTYCTPITWAQAQPGDLVFYPEDTHVGIVCGFDRGGNVQIIHCASGSNNVVVTGKIGFKTIARPKYYS